MTTDLALRRSLERRCRRFPGRTGVYARTGDLPPVSLRGSERFPAASVIKLGILLSLYAAAAEGSLDPGERISLAEGDRTEGSGVLAGMAAGLSLSLADLALLMIVVSDNTASNMLIDRLGLEQINTRLHDWGCRRTELQRRFFDLRARARGLNNWITADDIGDLLWRLAGGELLPPAETAVCLGVLKRQQFQDRIPALLPEGVEVGNKTGSIAGVCHDAAIVFGSRGPVVVVGLTEGGASPAQAEGLLRRLGRAVYDAWG